MSLLYGDLVRIQNTGDQSYMGGCNNAMTCGVPLTLRAGDSGTPGDWTLFKIGGGDNGTPINNSNNFTLTCQYTGLPGYNAPISYCAETSFSPGGPGNFLCTGSVFLNNDASLQTNLFFSGESNISYNTPMNIYMQTRNHELRFLAPCGNSTRGGACPYNIGLSPSMGLNKNPSSKWVFIKVSSSVIEDSQRWIDQNKVLLIGIGISVAVIIFIMIIFMITS